MSDYDNTNTGALFRADKGDNPKRPDYRGSVNVDGRDYWLSAWIKTSKKGDKYMSLQVQAKDAQPAPKGDPAAYASVKGAPMPDFDDQVPF